MTTLMLSLILPALVMAAAPRVDMVLTSGISANLKPRNNLSELPRAKGEFTVYLQWKNLPTRKKWLVLNDSDPVTYKVSIYDASGSMVSQEVEAFTPDESAPVTWVEHKIESGHRSGRWTVILEAFGKRQQKAIRIYD